MAAQDERQNRAHELQPAGPDKYFMLPTSQDVAQIEKDLHVLLWERVTTENDPYRQLDMLMSGTGSPSEQAGEKEKRAAKRDGGGTSGGDGSQRPHIELPAPFRTAPATEGARKHCHEPEASFDIRKAAPRVFGDSIPPARSSVPPTATRPFHVYVGDKQHRVFSHTIQLSKPGRLQDFDHIGEGDLRAIRESPENAAWHAEVSQLFWRRVMEYNADIIPPDGAIQQKVYGLLCRSNILIEDLWTAHQVYKTTVLPVHWRANGEPSLLRLRHWMAQGGDAPTWRDTLDAKASDYEKLVPWVPRERLIALCILLRKGHPEDLSTVQLNGEPHSSRKLKQSMTMARKKHAWIGDCGLLYQCQDDAVDPQPPPYWAGFQAAVDAGQVRLWDEASAPAYQAEDEAAKCSYEMEGKRAKGGILSRGPSVPPTMNGQQLPAASGDVKAPMVGDDAHDRAGGGLQNMDHGHVADDRVRRLEEEVAQLQDYTDSMYAHLAAHLKDFPAPPPWKKAGGYRFG